MPDSTAKELKKELAEMTTRVKNLEAAVFGDGPGGWGGPFPGTPGPGGLGARLETLAEELAALREESSRNVQELDTKIDTVVRITAELTKIAQGLQRKLDAVEERRKEKVMEMKA